MKGIECMKIVIFGTQMLASYSWYVLTHDSPHEVVGFTIDGAYLRENTLHGLPVVAFEQVEKHFPPESVAMIVPLGVHNLNASEKKSIAPVEPKAIDSFHTSRPGPQPGPI
jgi:hypothetical protein